MTVRLYCVLLDDRDDTQSAWRGYLSPAEQLKADRFHQVRDRLTFTAAHALKRLAIADILGGEPHRLDFAALPNGKPFLATPMDACAFNLSHTAGCVAVALSDRPLGVDVENIHRTTVDQSLAVTAFGQELSATLGRDPLSAQWRDAFFMAWTAREAVLKADGAGLSLPMSQVGIEGNGARLNGRRWHLRQWALADHRMALAWDGEQTVERVMLNAATFTEWCMKKAG